MILYINTSNGQGLGVFLLKNNKVISQLSISGDYKVSEKLLALIGQLLKENKGNFKVLKGIIVVSGPGPFTSIRIAVAVANTLAYALKIPVIGVKNIDNRSTDDQLMKMGLKLLAKVKRGKYASPFYNQEPNITKKN